MGRPKGSKNKKTLLKEGKIKGKPGRPKGKAIGKRGRPPGASNKPKDLKIEALIEKAVRDFVGTHKISITVGIEKMGRRGRKPKGE